MSRHVYRFERDERTIEVLLGWDRPLQHVFLVVEDLSDDDDGGTLYNNLQEADPSRLTLEYFRDVLKRLDIQVPESMFAEVEIDRRMNAGNRFAKHQANGEFISTG